jgi:hypothetical protein
MGDQPERNQTVIANNQWSPDHDFLKEESYEQDDCDSIQ